MRLDGCAGDVAHILKEGAVILDISVPSNIDRAEFKERPAPRGAGAGDGVDAVTQRADLRVPGGRCCA